MPSDDGAAAPAAAAVLMALDMPPPPTSEPRGVEGEAVLLAAVVGAAATVWQAVAWGVAAASWRA